MVGSKLSLFVCLILLPFCLSQNYVNILFSGQAATLVGPAPYQLALKPLIFFDPYQQWYLDSEGFIVSRAQPNYAWDVAGYFPTSNAPVGIWEKKSDPNSNLNQKWAIQSDGALRSQLADGYFAKPVLTFPSPVPFLVMDFYSPVNIPEYRAVPVNPLVCSSVGTAHIIPFAGIDRLTHPGLQRPGEFLLARFGSVRVVALQRPCDGVADAAVYCTHWTAVAVGKGQNVVVLRDGVLVNGVAAPASNYLIQVTADVKVLRHGSGDFTVYVPGGHVSVQATTPKGQDVKIVVTSGEYPSGGLCVQDSSLGFNEFVEKWRIPSYCESPYPHATPADFAANSPTSYATSSGNFTTEDPDLLGNATLRCSPLASGDLVASCSSVIDPALLYESCRDDVIVTRDFSAAASVVNGYAAQCGLRSTTPVTLPTSGIDTVAYGPGLGGQNGDLPVPLSAPTTFLVETRDALKQPVHFAGGQISVESTGPSALTFDVADLGGGLYEVQYTPSVVGDYEISVAIRGVERIAGGAYDVTVSSYDTNAALSSASGRGLEPSVPVGEAVEFTVFARTEGGIAKPHGGDSVEVTISPYTPAFVFDNKDGTYRVMYRRSQLVELSITVRINGAEIGGSPFRVTAAL